MASEESKEQVKPAPATGVEGRHGYSPPKLIVWGSLRDLTSGPASGNQDPLGLNGTENV